MIERAVNAIGLALLVGTHLFLVGDRIGKKTPTLDEIAHLPAGISYLEKRTFRMYPHNPPLARVLAALPTRVDPPAVYYDGAFQKQNPPSHWDFAYTFEEINSGSDAARRRYLDSFARGRWVIALWSASTILVIHAWGSRWFGRGAGGIAAILYAFSPTIIAHATFITTDIAATASGLVAAFTFSLWLERNTWPRALLAGVCLGLAQLTKFSALQLYPLLAIWALFDVAIADPGGWKQILPWRLMTRRGGRQALAIGLVSVVIINAGYLFEGMGKPLGEFRFVSASLTRPRGSGDPPAAYCSNRTYNEVLDSRVNRFAGSWLASLPAPVPAAYLTGFDEQKFEAESKYQMYLRGEWAAPADSDDLHGKGRRRGWVYYYLYALGIKTPISTLLVWAMGLIGIAWFRDIPARRWFPLAMLGFAPLASMSLFTDINLGVRYVLPALPFLDLIGGSAFRAGRPRFWNGASAIVSLGALLAVARCHPHELGFFNRLIGDPANARWHLVDSNLDWGEDLRGLSRWLEAHPDWKREVKLAYLGTISPEFEGIAPYRLAPRDLRHVPESARWPWEDPDDPRTYGPQPGKFAVSANFERGMFFHTPCPIDLLPQVLQANPRLVQGTSRQLSVPRNAYAYFSHFTPRIDPAIGPSILLYDITPAEAAAARREMGLPLLDSSAASPAP